MPANSQMQAVLDQYAKFDVPPIESLSPENARNAPTLKNAVEEMAAESFATRLATVAKPMPQPVGSIRHVVMPGPGSELLARVFIPAGKGPFPVLVYFYGGGWVISNLDVHEPSCRALCRAAESVIVSVAYRQAPEHKYPAAVEDAYAATQWCIANARRWNGDPGRVAVAGEGAGGNLAAVVCLKARDEGGRIPAAQLLVYPVTDYRMNTPSYRENATAKPLSASMMPWFWKHYLRDSAEGAQPYASPLRAINLQGLPPAIVITAEIDPLRDEGESYARHLAENGVPVSARRFEGVTHEFFGLAGVVHEATEAVAYAGDQLKSLLASPAAAAVAA
jgi:acetyl esterase